ncbi:hypothetical protein [Floridanema evergladense]|uniref:Uncharacterized protein n=1 Tax=Floridaenema evergladense BLCC-F167 TaxID=3153639 RepID=A0ABV4WD34_9CYAN
MSVNNQIKENNNYINNDDGIAAAISAATYADREAQRQRSEIKNRSIANLEIETERLKMRCAALENELERVQNMLDGGALGMGLAYSVQLQQKEIADLRSDFELSIKKGEEARSINLQKTAIVIGLIASICGGIVPVIMSHLFINDKVELKR